MLFRPPYGGIGRWPANHRGHTALGGHPPASASPTCPDGTASRTVFRELGSRSGEAEALNNLGELSSRTSDTGRPRDYHSQALAIARDTGSPLEEARALEGLGQSSLTEGTVTSLYSSSSAICQPGCQPASDTEIFVMTVHAAAFQRRLKYEKSS